MKKTDSYFLISIFILILVLSFLGFSIRFLYYISKLATSPDQDKINSQVTRFDLENYKKLDQRFK